MEKKETKIFYLGIAQDEIYAGSRKLQKAGLPVKELRERLEYPGGYLRIFYAMLPEFGGRRILRRKGRTWNLKKRQRIVRQTLEKAHTEGYSEVLLSEKLAFKEQEAGLELRAAYLHKFMPFEQVCISFSGEGGTFEAREAVMLLSPYLRRMRKVIFGGEESVATELFTDYLFYEYGIVPEKKKNMQIRDSSGGERLVWLDFDDPAADKRSALQDFAFYSRINHAEALKFLDTTIKNGYNTES